MRQFSKLEQRLLNEFQQGMPLTPNPYADIARQLGVYETTVLETLKRLQTEGVVSRVGAVFRPNRVGASTLAAMAVPEEQLEEIAAIVNEFDEVNHNYEARCGFSVLDLPLLEEFFIDLGFDLKWT
jgi:DNA-binding Lrp family transcriptional regulator